MVDVGEKLESKTNDKPTKTIKENNKSKTQYVVKNYFIGTKTLSELIERLATKEAKESSID